MVPPSRAGEDRWRRLSLLSLLHGKPPSTPNIPKSVRGGATSDMSDRKSHVSLRTRLEASVHPMLSTCQELIHGNIVTGFSSRHPCTHRIHGLAAYGSRMKLRIPGAVARSPCSFAPCSYDYVVITRALASGIQACITPRSSMAVTAAAFQPTSRGCGADKYPQTVLPLQGLRAACFRLRHPYFLLNDSMARYFP